MEKRFKTRFNKTEELNAIAQVPKSYFNSLHLTSQLLIITIRHHTF